MQKAITFVLVLLLFVQLSLALETDINIKSKSSTVVYVKMLHNEGPNAGKLIDNQSNLKFTSSAEGKISFTYKLDKESTIRISAKANDMESFIIYKDIPNGKSVLLDLTSPALGPIITNRQPGQVNTPQDSSTPAASPSPSASPATNSSRENSSTTTIPQSTATGETEASTTGSKSFFDTLAFKIIIYTIVALFLISILIFIIFSIIKIIKNRKKSPENEHIKTVKFSDRFHSAPHIRSLQDAEKKLIEAQEEIQRFKLREKEIKDLEKKLKDDEYRLKKLRGY